jgi:hypothetical protein
MLATVSDTGWSTAVYAQAVAPLHLNRILHRTCRSVPHRETADIDKKKAGIFALRSDTCNSEPTKKIKTVMIILNSSSSCTMAFF